MKWGGGRLALNYSKGLNGHTAEHKYPPEIQKGGGGGLEYNIDLEVLTCECFSSGSIRAASAT